MTITPALIETTHPGTQLFLGTITLLLFVSLWMAPPSMAQERPDGPPPGPPPPEQIEAHMRSDMGTVLEKLALSDETVARVQPILEADIQKRLTLIRNHKPSPDRQARETMHLAMMELDEETRKALAAILSDTEMERYKQIRKTLRANRPHPPRRDNSQGSHD